MNLAETSSKNLEDIVWNNVRCSPAIVNRSQWKNVRIECREHSCDLSNMIVSGCCFQDCYFGNAQLRMSNVLFEECNFVRTIFMFGQLEGAVFEASILDSCLLRRANLRGATFRDSRLVSVDLEKADLRDCTFENTELIRMDQWGWHGYHGAHIPDEQRFKYFITHDIVARVREAIHRGELAASQAILEPFLDALAKEGIHKSEVMLIHEEWKELVDFPTFVAIGKVLTSMESA